MYEVAELLGIKPTQGRKIPLSGIGGKISGYLHTIRLEVAGHFFSCQVCFSKELRVPLNLLGRQDFFQQFRITFDESKEIVILDRPRYRPTDYISDCRANNARKSTPIQGW